MIRQFGILVLTINTAAVVSWLFVPAVNAQQDSTTTVWQDPAKLIDAKAQAMSANDENSVRAVADAIFNYPHAFGRAPVAAEQIIKDRLVAAEIAYLQGKSSGITEQDVAVSLNQIATRLQLPDYAKTSAKQVRVMRLNLALSSPKLMGPALSRPNMHVGESIPSEMSPLQAAHLAAVLFDQKFLNPDLQVTPDEWDQNFHDKALERIRQIQAERTANKTPQTTHRLMARNNPKRDEMRQAFSHAISSMSETDGLSLANEIFTTLKLN